MLSRALSKDGDRFTIPHANFTHTGKIIKNINGLLISLDIMNQDNIHNGKKLTYPLDHAITVLRIGCHLIHIHQLRLVSDRFGFHEHGLRKEDIDG